jgi:hypothetical protein
LKYFYHFGINFNFNPNLPVYTSEFNKFNLNPVLYSPGVKVQAILDVLPTGGAVDDEPVLLTN